MSYCCRRRGCRGYAPHRHLRHYSELVDFAIVMALVLFLAVIFGAWFR